MNSSDIQPSIKASSSPKVTSEIKDIDGINVLLLKHSNDWELAEEETAILEANEKLKTKGKANYIMVYDFSGVSTFPGISKIRNLVNSNVEVMKVLNGSVEVIIIGAQGYVKTLVGLLLMLLPQYKERLEFVNDVDSAMKYVKDNSARLKIAPPLG